MKIITIPVGQLQTNCYLLCDESSGVCAVIDPGDEGGRILRAAQAEGCTPCAVFLTHGHYDHFLGLPEILQAYPSLGVYIHEADTCPSDQSPMLAFPRLGEENQRYYREGDQLQVGSISLRVMETPGHSKGSVCLVAENTIFCGDTLFYGSCGRTDFPGGSYEEILRSLGRLGKLEGDYRCLCGHERETTLSLERRQNPYLRLGMKQ